MKIMSAALLTLSVSGLKNPETETTTANIKTVNNQQKSSPTAHVIQFPSQHLRGTQNHRFLHATEAPTPAPTPKLPTDLDEPSTCAFLKSELDKTKAALESSEQEVNSLKEQAENNTEFLDKKDAKIKKLTEGIWSLLALSIILGITTIGFQRAYFNRL